MRKSTASLPHASNTNRLVGLDAARGAAMGLVCLAHFQDAYLYPLYPLGIGAADGVVTFVTRAATPTFILVSGFVLGFLYFENRRGFDDLRLKLIDRALFLLTVARAAIMVAHVPIVGLEGALDTIFVTDTIAVCVLVGTVVVPAVGARSRAALALLLYTVATVVLWLWIPQPGSSAQFVKHLLVGHREDLTPSVFLYSFPIAQWLAVYLVGTALGEWLARARASSGSRGFAGLLGLSVALMSSGVLVWGLRSQLELLPGFAGPSHRVLLLLLTSPWQRLPPGLDYLLCYLGLALLLVTSCLWLERVRPGVLGFFSLLGRNSLPVFVAQYFIFYSLIFSLHLPYTPLWPLLFAVSFLVLVPATHAWEQLDGQRLLTVGYPRLAALAGRLRAAR